MTTREFLIAVANANVSEEITAKAAEMVLALDAKNAKRKSTPTKEQRESASRVGAVLDFFRDHQGTPFTRDAIAEAVNITPSQVTAACKPLVVNGMIVKTEAKIDKSRRVVYTMPQED